MTKRILGFRSSGPFLMILLMATMFGPARAQARVAPGANAQEIPHVFPHDDHFDKHTGVLNLVVAPASMGCGLQDDGNLVETWTLGHKSWSGVITPCQNLPSKIVTPPGIEVLDRDGGFTSGETPASGGHVITFDDDSSSIPTTGSEGSNFAVKYSYKVTFGKLVVFSGHFAASSYTTPIHLIYEGTDAFVNICINDNLRVSSLDHMLYCAYGGVTTSYARVTGTGYYEKDSDFLSPDLAWRCGNGHSASREGLPGRGG